MVFKSPFFLFFLPLVFLPLILHFLLRFLRKKIPFPWVGLFKRREEREKRRRKLEEILLLLLRTAFLFFLLLFLSKPFLGKFFPRKIIVDSSFSTNLYKEEFNSVLKKIKNVFDTTDIVFLNELEREDMEKVWLLTDLKSSFFENFKYRDSVSPFIFVPEEQKSNASIVNVLRINSRFEVTIFYRGEVKDERELRIFFQDNPLFSRSINLLPNEKQTISIDLPAIKEGVLRFELFPHDALMDDDVFFYSIVKEREIFYKVYGENKYLESILTSLDYARPDKKLGDSTIVFFLGIPEKDENMKILIDRIKAGYPTFLFLDSSPKGELKRYLKDMGLSVSEPILQSYAVKINNEQVHFKNFQLIKGGRGILGDKERIAVLILEKKFILLGFVPEPNFTSWIYEPSFPLKMIEFISLIQIEKKRHYNANEKKIVSLGIPFAIFRVKTPQGEVVDVVNADSSGEVSMKNFPFGSYILEKEQQYWIDVNTPEKEILTGELNQEQLKSLLGNPLVYSFKKIEDFLPKKLDTLFLFLALLALLGELSIMLYRAFIS